MSVDSEVETLMRSYQNNAKLREGVISRTYSLKVAKGKAMSFSVKEELLKVSYDKQP
jgi:hypothetical protein